MVVFADGAWGVDANLYRVSAKAVGDENAIAFVGTFVVDKACAVRRPRHVGRVVTEKRFLEAVPDERQKLQVASRVKSGHPHVGAIPAEAQNAISRRSIAPRSDVRRGEVLQ